MNAKVQFDRLTQHDSHAAQTVINVNTQSNDAREEHREELKSLFRLEELMASCSKS